MKYNFIDELILTESFQNVKKVLTAIDRKPLEAGYNFVKNNVYNNKKGLANSVKRQVARTATKTFGVADAAATAVMPPMPSPDSRGLEKAANSIKAWKGDYKPTLENMKEVADAGITKSLISFAKRTSALDQIFVVIPGVIYSPQPFGAVLRGLGISSVDCINMYRDYLKTCYAVKVKPSLRNFVQNVTDSISKMFSRTRNLNPNLAIP